MCNLLKWKINPFCDLLHSGLLAFFISWYYFICGLFPLISCKSSGTKRIIFTIKSCTALSPLVFFWVIGILLKYIWWPRKHTLMHSWMLLFSFPDPCIISQPSLSFMIFICLRVPAYKYSFIILFINCFYHIKSIPLLSLNSLTVTNSMLSVLAGNYAF